YIMEAYKLARRTWREATHQETADEVEDLLRGALSLTQSLNPRLAQERIKDNDLRERYRDLEILHERTLQDLDQVTAGQQSVEKRYHDLRVRYKETLNNLTKEATARHEAEERVTKLEKLVTHNIEKIGQKFVVVLIDADNYKVGASVTILTRADQYSWQFQKVFLSNMADGGGLAAEELLAKTRHYFQTHLNEPSLNIMVYAYANIEGLSKACLRENRTKTKDLQRFVGQFNARYPLVNFIDVGYGDQRADCKIQGLVRFYLENKFCEHILLCLCHDGGYVPFLRPLLADEANRSRMTLVKGATVATGFRNLGLPLIEMPSVFSSLSGNLEK
ncbi:MAG: hypothetical protein Q9204_007461, partial [Flavoplaca sp. TL-2023a]